MMSHNPSFAWPAGHLIRPKSRSETYDGPYAPPGTWDDYARDGIGPETRIPLWELVFHDCVVTTWYWGDASDYLRAFDPANQDRKDLFNVLYGTMAMIWANEPGGWNQDRERAIRTCKVTGAAFAAVAGAELVDHAFLTPDRQVQRTRFGNGVEIVVNFGTSTVTLPLADEKLVLSAGAYLMRGTGSAVTGP
jgi:hypothetical protein